MLRSAGPAHPSQRYGSDNPTSVSHITPLFVNRPGLHFLPLTAMLFLSFSHICLGKEKEREEDEEVESVCICVCKRAVSTLINCGEITWFSKRGVCHQKPLHRSISRFSTVSRLIWRGAVSLKTDRRVKLVMRDAGLGKKRHLQLAREWSVNKYVLPTQATLYQLSLKIDRQWLVHLKPQAGILMGVLSVGLAWQMMQCFLYRTAMSQAKNTIILSDADGRR